MQKNLIISGIFLIASYTASSQDSLLVSIDDLRKASELIIEGDRCAENEGILASIIANKDTQIQELKEIIILKDSSILHNYQIMDNKDKIIENKAAIAEQHKKEAKKYKRLTYVSGAMILLSLLF